MKALYAYTEELVAKSFSKYTFWVDRKMNGPLKYLEDNRQGLRRSLKDFWPKCESALVFLFPYERFDKEIASYALAFNGDDYHLIISSYLQNFASELSKNENDLEYKVAIDTSPILERDLAYRAGLGWIGKNSMLLNQSGSYFLIGTILFSKKLSGHKAQPIQTDHCGNCTKCVDSCPTEAINKTERSVDARLCLSTHTIEIFKETIFPKDHERAPTLLFGCDICQQVCPWNSKVSIQNPKNSRVSELIEMDLYELKKWLEVISNREYQRHFKGTSLFRTGRIGLLKNVLRVQSLLKD